MWLGLSGAGLTSTKAAEPPPFSQAAAAEVIWPQLTLTLAVSGLAQPVHIAHAGDGSGRLFAVEQAGRIRLVKDGALLNLPFLDLSPGGANRVKCCGEEGLLSLAFPPGYGASKNHFYVYYVNKSGDLVIARYQVSAGNPDLADPGSEQVVLEIKHPTFTNHNGGQLAFGPRDGYLYAGPGDGGSGGDPPDNAQSGGILLGKLLRIDVESGTPATYTIPASNPYTQTSGYRGEIWALGLRNPWRFSFDRLTGDVYIGDVGQNAREEIDFQLALSSGGENYGWRILEGSACFSPPDGCLPPERYSPPVAEYEHGPGDSIGCSVTGGFVYRGARYTLSQGIYFYADYCTGRIWGLQRAGNAWQSSQLLDTALSISTFGEDQAGNLYLADHVGGRLYLVGDVEFKTHLPFIAHWN